MGFLLGPIIASIVGSLVILRIFDWIFGGLTGTIVNTARASVFVTTWTAITAQSGMSGFTSKVRKLRRGTTAVSEQLDALTKRDRQ